MISDHYRKQLLVSLEYYTKIRESCIKFGGSHQHIDEIIDIIKRELSEK